MTEWVFVRRVLTVFAIGALLLGLWTLSDLLLLVFAAALCAVALRALMTPLVRVSGVSEPVALAIIAFSLIGLVAIFILQFGPPLADQMEYLVHQLPLAVHALSQQFDFASLAENVGGSALGAFALRAMAWGTSLFAAIAAFVLVLVGGLYLAAAPGTYRRGCVALFPQRWHHIIDSTLSDGAYVLTQWLRAQLIAMVLIGAMTGFGMWLVGVPSPLALGLIAGFTEFVPIVGPIVGAIPALLLASGEGWQLCLSALAVAVVVQQIENNLIMPFVVGRVVDLPPAVGLFATVAIGILFGPLGLLLGYPLAVVADVAIRRLYVREALGETVDIPAERERHQKPSRA
jgi:predicted PurR-regulated permease PerM